MSNEFLWLINYYDLSLNKAKQLVPYITEIDNIFQRKVSDLETLMSGVVIVDDSVYKKCDRLFLAIELTKMSDLLLEATLRITSRSRSELLEWFPLRKRIYDELESRGRDIDNWLRGLPANE